MVACIDIDQTFSRFIPQQSERDLQFSYISPIASFGSHHTFLLSLHFSFYFNCFTTTPRHDQEDSRQDVNEDEASGPTCGAGFYNTTDW
jgi:hypothetical protein